jgi:hypothetical protein
MKAIVKPAWVKICWMHFQAERSETRRYFIAIAFKLCFRICHEVGPRKSGRIGIEWNTVALGLW